MADLTAREVRIIARHGFAARLDAVLVATIAYQRARAEHLRADGLLADANLALAAAEAHEDSLPAGLELTDVARRQVATAAKRMSSAQRVMRARAETFFDAAGTGAGTLVALMEHSGFTLDRTGLLEELSDGLEVG